LLKDNYNTNLTEMKIDYTNEIIKQKIKTYSYEIVGSVMYKYTEWIIEEAIRRGFSRLYFLARDGYLLYEMAKLICQNRALSIDCKYLYCSRQSLRIPSYHIIGDEAFDLLLLGGYYVTPKTILSRACLTEEEISTVCKELGIMDENKPFSDNELENFTIQIKSNDLYRSSVMKKSRAAYESTISYFKQEGLFDNDYVAIVDSGWTGSMQRSLRQLLESAGYKGTLTGFYFGMYVEPKDKKDGEYLTFYFDSNSGVKRKIAFNNNLFECMLSANHAMTVGYEEGENGFFNPKFTPPISATQKGLAESQISGALEYAKRAIAKPYAPFEYKISLRQCYKILKKNMVYPSKDFATVYGAFTFCDDVTEGYHMSLADPENRRALSNYMLIPRIFRKLFGIKKSNASELFWPYGVIAFCPAFLRPWYRINVQAWELLKAILKK